MSGIPVGPVQSVTTVMGAIATLAILSVVYRENRFYRFFEHVFIGVATGFLIFVTWRDALSQMWWEPLTKGLWYWCLAPLVALLFYTVYFPKYAWMSRFIVTVLLGLGAGLVFRSFASQVFPQVTSSFLCLRPDGKEVTWLGAAENAVFLVTLLSVMTYFFFSFRHEHPVIKGTARLGRWLLMVAFGATFGTTVMARFSLLIDRLQFLLFECLYKWLHIPH